MKCNGGEKKKRKNCDGRRFSPHARGAYPWNPLLERKPKEEFKKENSDTTSTTYTTDEYSKYRAKQARFLIKFQTSLARDLETENYIERKNNEKKHVFYQITPSGEYALYLYGLSNKMTAGKDDIILIPQ